jgi:uncharacterized protein (TIGR02246 family)
VRNVTENEAIVRAMFDALNRDDPDTYTDYFTEDATYINAYGQRKNKEEIREEMIAIYQTFQNFRNRILRMDSIGDTVWVEFRYSAEVSGRALVSIMSRFYGEEGAREKYGMSDSVKSFDIPHVYILDFVGGKVKQWTCYYNTDLLMMQLKD